MKTAAQILAEIDRVIDIYDRHYDKALKDEEIVGCATAMSVLKKLKQFMLSGEECEHEYKSRSLDGKNFSVLGCAKCGDIKDEVNFE